MAIIEPQILVPAFSIRSLNWLLLTLCVVIVILVSFFLFYWNRFLGWMLGHGLRFLWWKRYHMWIECESIQFSFLAGRILLKDVQYHSSNMSIRVLHCHITWRYWLWRTREGEDVQYELAAGEEPEKSSQNQSEDLPCRVHIYLEGVEWFIYNRTPSYNAIIQELGVPDVLNSEAAPEVPFPPVAAPIYPPTPSSLSLGISSLNEENTIWNRLRNAAWRLRMPEIDFNEILPVGLMLGKGALIIGNDSTPSILIMDLAGGSGSYGVSQSRSKLDKYKEIYDIQLNKVKIITRTNPDYKGRMFDRGNKVLEDLTSHPSQNDLTRASYLFDAFHALAHRLHLPFSAPVTPDSSAQPQNQKKWGGLPRYHADNDSNEKAGTLHEPEYAKSTCLLDTPLLNIIYYADVAGKVPHHPKPVPTEMVDIGNGDEAPEWGVELELHGGPGLITYGPWTDRQRVHWQQMLAPPTYQNTQPTERLKPGELRQAVSLRVSVRFRDAVKLRVPTREASKDWRYDGRGDLDAQRRRHRPFGWLDLRFEAGSFLKYTVPLVASRDGFRSTLEVELVGITALSSVNQVEFLRTDSCSILCVMPSPHSWRAERKWDVQINMAKSNIKLLRDHINLLTDIMGDWTSVSPPDSSDTKRLKTEEYERFVPTVYAVGISLDSYRLDLYANDHNIVDWPLSHLDNSILSITGPNLQANLSVLSNEFHPEVSSTPFSVAAPRANIALSMPKWNTHSAFATPRTSDIGSIGSLIMSGSYTTYAEVRSDAVDRLKLDVEANGVTFKAFGWAVRHLMVIKENYFGMFTNFSMRNEYFTKMHGQNIGDPVQEKYREGKSNPFEVDLGLLVSNSVLVLPQEIYDCQAGVVLDISDLQLLLRLHEYAMEMSLNISPFALTVIDDVSAILNQARAGEVNTKDLLRVQGLDIIANRLFGPQPEVATYLCLWEILPAEISGALSISSVVGLLAAIRAFRINFSDDFNAPSVDFTPPTIPDVTFLRVKCPLLDVTVGLGDHAEAAAPRDNAGDTLLHLSLSKGFSVQLTDRPNPSYASCMRFDVPTISARVIQRVTGFHQTWFELAGISFDLAGEKTDAPLGWKERVQEQQTFIQIQDKLTRRVGFLYGANVTLAEAPRHGGLTYLTPLRAPDGFAGHGKQDGSVHESTFEPKEYEDSLRSEQDDVMTEASRDARVANSRPATPQVLTKKPVPASQFRARAPDGDMSSGDESDNDLTEYEPSMNSSIAPPGDDDVSVESSEWPYVDHYRQALRRYRPVYTGHNADYETFCLKHDPTRSFSSPVEDLHGIQHPNSRKQDAADHESTSTFKINVQHGFNMVLTPTCVPFVCEMLTKFDTQSSTLDSLADAILDDFLDAPSLNQSAVAARSSLSLDIPFIEIRLLQSIMSSTEADALSTGVHHRSAVPIHVDARVLALFDIEVHQVSGLLETLVTSSAQQTVVSFQTALIDSRLRTLVNKPFAHSRYELEPSLDKLRLKLSGIKINLASNNPSYVGTISCEASDIFVSDKSPEILITTLATSGHSFSQVSAFLESRSDLLSRRRRYFVWATLHHLQSQTVAADPFATYLPSFLVQTGRPGRLRSDPSWKTLTITRQSVRQMGPIEKRVLQNNLSKRAGELPDKQLTELLPFMEKQWADLYGQDEHGLPKITPVLQSLFSSPSLNTSPLVFRAVCEINCRHTKAVLQSHGGDYNELVLENSRLNLRGSTMDYAPPEDSTSKSAAVREKAVHLVVIADVRRLSMSVYPSCVLFVRQVLRVRRQINSKSQAVAQSPSPTTTSLMPFQYLVVELFFNARLLDFAAPAQQITFEAQTSGCSANITSIIRLPGLSTPPEGSISFTIAANRISLQASQGKSQRSSKSLLAGIELSNATVHGAISEAPKVPTQVRLLLDLNRFKINVPRSVLRIYRFVDSWRTEYLPTYDSMIQDLLSELGQNSGPNNPPSFVPQLFSGNFKFDGHAQLREFRVELHVMHGTWLSWDVLSSTTFVDARGLKDWRFGSRIGSQHIHLTNGELDNQRTPAGMNSVYLELPSLRLEGKYPQLDVRLHMDHFSVTLKPQYVDDFLAIQQKFGSDFNELVELALEFKNQGGAPAGTITDKPTTSVTFPRFDVSFAFEGFRIGIEGPTSTQYLDSSRITGRVHSGSERQWSFRVESLALSLAQHSKTRRTRSGFDRKYRSAYMVFDMSAENIEYPEAAKQDNHLGVVVNFVHAVMQPAAIAELGDLIDHVQAEMLSRQEQRASELEEVRRKTRQVMRTLESSEHPHTVKEAKTFLDNRKIEFTLKDIGIVFPLTLQDDMLPQMGSPTITPLSPSSVSAFLISLKTVSFVTQRYETGQAKLEAFSFQFMPNFDQSQPSHFKGDTHEVRNRMVYPLMEAEVRSEATPTARQIWIHANVSGFEVDLEPSIANYLFSIVDVYRQGRDRMSKLAAYAPKSDAGSSTASLVAPTSSSAPYSAILTTNLKASFEFKSGRIRSHNTTHGRTNDLERSQSLSDFLPEDQSFERVVDTLDLPMVSALLEYRATPASHKALGSTSLNQSTLVCNTTVHPISNILRPSLLPFLTDVFKRVQERLAHAPVPSQSPDVAPFSDLSTIHEGLSLEEAPQEDSPVIGSMQVIFSLDINESSLKLTCQPDVNVVAGLNWERGGFIVTISPGAREVAVVGTLSSITAGIQHGYLSEDSVSAKAQNLAFSVDFRKLKDSNSMVTNTVSVVVNTEVGANMRFSRLQDLLCFKAVWLDRIPVFDSLARPAPVHSTPAVIKAELPGGDHIPPKQPFQTLVLVNIEKANIVADLGQAIAKSTLALENLVLRTKLCEEVSEATLSIDLLEFSSERAVVGHVRMPDFMFHTVRRRHGKVYQDDQGHSKMLELVLKSGDIEAAMEYERQHLMHFHADPLHVVVFDDWSKVNSETPIDEREVSLDFNIQAGDLLAYASTATIPKMITVGGKLAALIKAQKQGAARESSAFRASQMPKPDTALSEVAAAMLQSAKSRFKETETFQFAIIQRLKLSIKTLKLAVPPPTQQRAELALFVARNVEGELHRTIRPHEPPCRNLQLGLGAFSIRGVPQHSTPDMQMKARDILTAFPYGTRLFLFPSTHISMHTSQSDHKVSYNFAIELTDRQAGEKGIYVALSFASWNWLLGIKRKFETDLEAALAEAALSGKDTPPTRRRKTIDTDPGMTSAEEEPGSRSVYHSPIATPRAMTPTSSTPASPRTATMTIPSLNTNVISIQPIRGSRGLEYEESTSQVSIDAPTLEVLGRATPDISNTPTFKGLKKALPTWVHEYTTLPIEEIMNVLLELYSKQLRSTRSDNTDEEQ